MFRRTLLLPSSETLVTYHIITRHHKAEDQKLKFWYFPKLICGSKDRNALPLYMSAMFKPTQSYLQVSKIWEEIECLISFSCFNPNREAIVNLKWYNLVTWLHAIALVVICNTRNLSSIVSQVHALTFDAYQHAKPFHMCILCQQIKVHVTRCHQSSWEQK